MRRWMRCCFGYIKTPLTTTMGPPSLAGLLKVKSTPSPSPSSPTVSLQATFQRFIFLASVCFFKPTAPIFFLHCSSTVFLPVILPDWARKGNGATLCGQVPGVEARLHCYKSDVREAHVKEVCFYPPRTVFLPLNFVTHFHKVKTKIAFIIRSLNSMITQLFLIFQHSVQYIMSPKSPNFVYLRRRS